MFHLFISGPPQSPNGNELLADGKQPYGTAGTTDSSESPEHPGHLPWRRSCEHRKKRRGKEPALDGSEHQVVPDSERLMELLNAVAYSATTASLLSFGRSHMCGGAGAAAAANSVPRTFALPRVAVQPKPAEPAGQTREAGRVSAQAVRPAAMAEPAAAAAAATSSAALTLTLTPMAAASMQASTDVPLLVNAHPSAGPGLAGNPGGEQLNWGLHATGTGDPAGFGGMWNVQ